MMELMDAASSTPSRTTGRWAWTGRGALLIAQSDAPGAACVAEIEVMSPACEAAGRPRSSSPTTPTRARCSCRPDGSPSRRSRPAARCCSRTWARRAAAARLLAAIAGIAEKYDLEIPVVAHAGDGNTHPVIVFDPDTAPEQRAPLASPHDAGAIGLGGTITGEHGVGRAKRDALPDQLGPEVMALTRTMKDALDPKGILNPGAIL